MITDNKNNKQCSIECFSSDSFLLRTFTIFIFDDLDRIKIVLVARWRSGGNLMLPVNIFTITFPCAVKTLVSSVSRTVVSVSEKSYNATAGERGGPSAASIEVVCVSSSGGCRPWARPVTLCKQHVKVTSHYVITVGRITPQHEDWVNSTIYAPACAHRSDVKCRQHELWVECS